MKFIAPIVHLNGDTKETLLDAELRPALEALRRAIDEVQAMMPHARNYYVAGELAYPKARREHIDRLRALQFVYDQLEAMHTAIQKGETEFTVEACSLCGAEKLDACTCD